MSWTNTELRNNKIYLFTEIAFISFLKIAPFLKSRFSPDDKLATFRLSLFVIENLKKF